MIDPSSTPSRQLHIFARFARWSLWLVLAFWLLLALVWGTLHGIIVPRIGEWRVQVERLATQALGAAVRVDAIEAKSDGLFPTVHLSGVSVLDAQGREALKLQSVVATVSARSVLRLGLEQLYIDAPELDIRHLADGRWQVAGLDVVQSDASESPALEWLLAQPELVIQKGVLLFTDEQRAVPTVRLHDVDLVLRNRHWNHVVRLDATPEAADGERMQVVGAFRQPLLPSSKAPWTRWSGQWYASLQLHRVPLLPWPEAWGVRALQGNGAARAWIDVQQGQLAGLTVDLALPQALVQWQDTGVADLDVRALQGRIEANWQAQAWNLKGQHFSFMQADGDNWPSSNWDVRLVGREGRPHSAKIALDYADLAMASQVVQTLPLPAQWRESMAQWTPQGELRQLQLQWQDGGAYRASGRVAGLTLQPQPAEQGVGVPGVQGLDARFELTEGGGNAQLNMQSGVLHFPGVFEEPAIPMDELQAQVRWSVKNGGHVKVDVSQVAFANADAQGTLHASWEMGQQAQDRLPGYLQLQGLLERANGARVHRYLPLEIPEMARHYVRDSVQQGQGSKVEFEVKGNLRDMPFERPGTGRFFIKAPVKNVIYEFAPASVQTPGEPAWPALTDLSGTLIFEGAGMTVQQASTGFVGYPKLRMGSVAAHIPDLEHPHLTVNALGQTDLNAALALVKKSPLAVFTSHALDATQAQGDASIAFDLELPIDHLERAKVRGRVGFQNNGLQFNEEAPLLRQLQGAVQFHDQGFELLNVRGQALGGSIKLEGGMPSLKQGVHILARGTATAQGLQKHSGIALLAQIAAHGQGQAAYTVDVNARNGAQDVTVRSDLRGIALNLPAPFSKQSDEALPLTVQQSLSEQQMQELRVDVQGRAQVSYTRNLSVVPAQVVQGRIVVGEPPNNEPLERGVSAYVQLPELDMDAWSQVLTSKAHSDGSETASQAQAYMPQRLKLSVDRLLVKQRELQSVKADFVQASAVWRGRLNAKHFAGQVEYRLPSASDPSGRLFARLSHLSIPKSEALRLNQATGDETSSEPETLPALDIEVERFEIAGKALGKLQLQARNSMGPSGRDWLLEQFYLTTPEARWKANGYWGAPSRGAPRTTHLSFLLELDSSGKLLERFGMPGVIRDGQGRLSGNIAWQGAPITPHWQSMDGGVHMQVDKGQFLKVEPGMGKLLSVLSLQSLTRRVALDFRDVFSQGFAFDYVRGDISIEQGVARTNNLQMKGLNAAVLMEGKASLIDETQDLTVVVVPEINAMTASLAATAINPVIGLGSFLAQMFLRGPLMEAATRTFHVHGPWSDPVVDPVSKKAVERKSTPSTEGVVP